MPLAVRRAALAIVLVAVLAVLAVPPALAHPGQSSARQAAEPAYLQGVQWGLEAIQAPAAWRRATGEGITIAIVDSGADLAHRDLRPNIVHQANCVGARGNPARCRTGGGADDNGHGTHVAGIAGAHGGQGRVAGVAPRASLMVVKVLTNECTNPADHRTCTAAGTAADVAAGIRWAAHHGADVINLSLGGGVVQSVAGCPFCDAIRYAWEQHGAISVVAAGNDAVLPSGFGEHDPVVVATATDRRDQRASYSNQASGIVSRARWPVAAPGGEAESDPSQCSASGRPEGILSTHWRPGATDQYACLAGTSMAAPHVAGALAVLLSHGLGPQQAVERLLATAVDLGPPGRDEQYGYGRVDLARALLGSTDVRASGPAGQAGATGGAMAPNPAPGTTVPTRPGAAVPRPGAAVPRPGAAVPVPEPAAGPPGAPETAAGDQVLSPPPTQSPAPAIGGMPYAAPAPPHGGEVPDASPLGVQQPPDRGPPAALVGLAVALILASGWAAMTLVLRAAQARRLW